MSTLKVGDKVLWRGSWGAESPVKVTVISIDRVSPGEKYGEPVDSMDWDEVPRYAVVSLDNGHWAYGQQLCWHAT